MFRRRTHPAPPPDVRTVSLDATAGDDQTVTRIDNPDLLSPVPHSLPAIDPHRTDLRAMVTHIVEGLAAGNALDEFTVAVLDGWIDRERTTWDAQVHETAQQRRHTAATILGQHLQNATAARDNLAVLRARRDRFAAEYDAACTAAGLPPAAQAQTDADATADATAAEPFALTHTLLAEELLAAPAAPSVPAPAPVQPAEPSTAGIDNIAAFPAHPSPAELPHHPSTHPSTAFPNSAVQNGDHR